MSKLLYFAVLLTLVGLLACGGEDATKAPVDTPAPQPTVAPASAAGPKATLEPTASPGLTAAPVPTATLEPTASPEPTAAPVPTATLEPTASPEPTAAPVPTATTAPEPAENGSESESGRIAPLPLDDPEAIAAELSDSELGCLAGTADIDRLLQIFASPEVATMEEQTQFIGCLEDETLTRLFLTGLIGDSGPLSEETSTCIRTGMEVVDLRSVMLAGTGGDAGASMAGSMSALFLTVSCLNEEEFAATGPSLGMSLEDRDSLQCVMETLGGPEGMAALIGSQDEAAFVGIFGAAAECGMEGMGGNGPGPGSGGMAPFPSDDPEAIAAELAKLSESELACLSGTGGTDGLLHVFASPELATRDEQAQLIGCLEDETLARQFLTGLIGDPGLLSEETSTCIRTGMEAVDLRSVMLAGIGGDPGAATAGSMSSLFLTVSCLNEEEFAAAGPSLGMSPEERESLQCVMGTLGGPEGLVALLGYEDEAAFMSLFGAAAECGMEGMEMGGPAGG